MRKLFAETPEAKVRGYQPGRFSFNVKGGRCENCAGDGTIKIEMNFLPDVYVPCEVCHGARYNRETLEVHYKGKTIAEVLDMPIEEAAEFFAAIPAISRHLKTLVDVGLGYVRLGQPAPTLSGGEAQRVKLASELQKRSTGRTIYVLDEPTTGLHFEDIRKLLGVLGRLVDAGNTVVVIEHNLDVIKTADWVIDMGPEGGSRGGMVIAEGTPEQIAGNGDSYTGGVPQVRCCVAATCRWDINGVAGAADRCRPERAAARQGAGEDEPAAKKAPVEKAPRQDRGQEDDLASAGRKAELNPGRREAPSEGLTATPTGRLAVSDQLDLNRDHDRCIIAPGPVGASVLRAVGLAALTGWARHSCRLLGGAVNAAPPTASVPTSSAHGAQHWRPRPPGHPPPILGELGSPAAKKSASSRPTRAAEPPKGPSVAISKVPVGGGVILDDRRSVRGHPADQGPVQGVQQDLYAQAVHGRRRPRRGDPLQLPPERFLDQGRLGGPRSSARAAARGEGEGLRRQGLRRELTEPCPGCRLRCEPWHGDSLTRLDYGRRPVDPRPARRLPVL